MRETYVSEDCPAVTDAEMATLYDLGIVSEDELFDQIWVSESIATYRPAMSPEDSAFRRVYDRANSKYSSTMTVEEQKAYAPVIQAYVAKKAEYRNVDDVPEEDKAIIEEGIRARDELVLRTLPLAAIFVRQTMGFYKNNPNVAQLHPSIIGDLGQLSSIPIGYSDRLQIAAEQLVKEAEKYTGNYAFTTRVVWALEKRFLRLGDQLHGGDLAKIPAYLVEEAYKYYKKFDGMVKPDGTAPTYDEITKQHGITEENARKYEDAMQLAQHIAYETVKERFDTMANRLVLDATEDEGILLEDTIVDEGVGSSIHEDVVLEALGTMLNYLISKYLSKKEREVIKRRFGLGPFEGGPSTLDEVGKVFGVTRERIRGIESKALARIRDSRHSDGLRKFITEGTEDPQFGMRAVVSISLDGLVSSELRRARNTVTEKQTNSGKSYAEAQKEETLAELRHRRELEESRKAQGLAPLDPDLYDLFYGY